MIYNEIEGIQPHIIFPFEITIRATLEYWEIDELIMEPCCALKVKYHIDRR